VLRHSQLHSLGCSTDAAAAAVAIVYFNIAANPSQGDRFQCTTMMMMLVWSLSLSLLLHYVIAA